MRIVLSISLTISIAALCLSCNKSTSNALEGTVWKARNPIEIPVMLPEEVSSGRINMVAFYLRDFRDAYTKQTLSDVEGVYYAEGLGDIERLFSFMGKECILDETFFYYKRTVKTKETQEVYTFNEGSHYTIGSRLNVTKDRAWLEGNEDLFDWPLTDGKLILVRYCVPTYNHLDLIAETKSQESMRYTLSGESISIVNNHYEFIGTVTENIGLLTISETDSGGKPVEYRRTK